MKTRSLRSASVVTILFWLLLLACARMRYTPPVHEPIIRVGILEQQESIHFEPQGPFQIQAQDSKENLKLNEPGLWTVRAVEPRPGQKHYLILLFESASEQKSRDQLERFKNRGVQAELKPFGEVLRAGTQALVDRRYYRVVLARQFDTMVDAELYLKTASNLANGKIIEEYDVQPGGVLVFRSPTGQEYRIHDRLRLLGSRITLKNVNVGSGYHWAHQESRSYAGELELAVDKTGKANVVNVVSLEAYLNGVVAGEMAPSFPPEALKAQAIVSRTLFLNNFYRFHRGADFDVCDEVHCQVYVGVTKQNESTSAAVNATRGQVLTYGDILCTASYSAVCGGHTEDASEVWEGDGQPYLQGEFDATEAGISSQAFDLKQEENVRLWIQSNPKVYCNLETAGQPSFAGYAAKYFRWQTRARRVDLEKWITEKTGTDIGTLIDIVPVRRGSSGRLSEIRLVGSRDSVTVTRELNIRRTLSETALYSACFVIDKEELANGVADSYVFSGAGWGHGVGMCQIGASVRALRGQNVGQILAAYYRGTRIKKMY